MYQSTALVALSSVANPLYRQNHSWILMRAEKNRLPRIALRADEYDRFGGWINRNGGGGSRLFLCEHRFASQLPRCSLFTILVDGCRLLLHVYTDMSDL